MSDQSGIKVSRRRGFTVIYNDLLPTDGSLSARAWGVYVYLTGRPDGWETRVSHLQTVFREGRDAIYAALRELVEVGLMAKETYIDNGLRRTRYTLDVDGAEPPRTDSQDPADPGTASPDTAFSDPGTPGPENTGEVTTESPITEVTSTEAGSTDADGSLRSPVAEPNGRSIEDEFVAWYAEYPRKVGRGQAAKAYRAARKKASAEEILAGLMRALPGLLSVRERQYIPHPATWLNGERWADDPSGVGLSPQAPSMSDAYRDRAEGLF